jgi:hypothetical protein
MLAFNHLSDFFNRILKCSPVKLYYNVYSRRKAAAAMLMRSALFWPLFLDFWPLKMGRTRCPGTSIKDYHLTLYNILMSRTTRACRMAWTCYSPSVFFCHCVASVVLLVYLWANLFVSYLICFIFLAWCYFNLLGIYFLFSFLAVLFASLLHVCYICNLSIL